MIVGVKARANFLLRAPSLLWWMSNQWNLKYSLIS